MLSLLALLPLGLPAQDWLVDSRPFKAEVRFTPQSISFGNGLISRTILLSPDAATVSLANQGTGAEMIRAVKPEALLTIDGKEIRVGGLVGQPNLAYLREDWIRDLKADPSALHFERVDSGKTEARMAWGRTLPSEGRPWPPPGVSVRLRFSNSEGLKVAVCYELYDGMPTYSKWLEVENQTGKPFRLNSFTSEYLGMVEAESVVDAHDRWILPNISVFTDYQFGGMALNNSNRTIHWEPDPKYGTQVNYDLKTPCDLHVRPPLGPDVEVGPGKRFNSFRTFVLVHDSFDRERKGLGVRKVYRSLAPWTTESPLMMHLTSSDPKVVHTAIDQAAECGFEMIILSFGSGLNMEDTSEANIAKYRAFRDAAHAKGLRFGGYSLLASRRISDEDDVINPKTGKVGGAIFGNSPCLGSKWGIRYFESIKTFIEKTGFDLLEHDGNYPGDV
ncbi:MAG: alpha-galactosidase, partial [Fimbriimonas sp.]